MFGGVTECNFHSAINYLKVSLMVSQIFCIIQDNAPEWRTFFFFFLFFSFLFFFVRRKPIIVCFYIVKVS